MADPRRWACLRPAPARRRLLRASAAAARCLQWLDRGPRRPASLRALLAALFHDLVLQREEPIHQRFGARRAAGDVNVDGDDLVDALEDAVVSRVGAAVRGA